MGLTGPLRLFNEKRFTGGTIYEGPTRKGFAGPYICDRCSLACAGVYLVEESWLCGACNSLRMRSPVAETVRVPVAMSGRH
jgi:hypothetical protein